MAILEVKNLRKIYTTRFGGNKVEALSNVNFSVAEGEFVAIMGESGSGKTTLLNILAALDKPTSGDVILAGKSLGSLKDKELSRFRRDNLGFVFQDFNLLDTFTLEDNIYLPLVLSGMEYSEMNGRLKNLAASLGISELLKKYPYEVSGGQKQRAAVARAVITGPSATRSSGREWGEAAPSSTPAISSTSTPAQIPAMTVPCRRSRPSSASTSGVAARWAKATVKPPGTTMQRMSPSAASPRAPSGVTRMPSAEVMAAPSGDSSTASHPATYFSQPSRTQPMSVARPKRAPSGVDST